MSVADLQSRAAKLLELRQWSAALEAYDALVGEAPDSVAGHLGRGRALMWLLRREEAAAAFQAAAALDPRRLEAHANYGLAMRELGRYAEALAGYERALALSSADPRLREEWLLTLADLRAPEAALDWLDAHGPPEGTRTGRDEYLRATLLMRLARFAEAADHFDRAAALEPSWPDPKHFRGVTRLALGDFARGWDDYEWRWDVGERTAYRAPEFLRRRMTRWPRPETFRDAEVVLLSEQGAGDILMFASMIPDVLAGARQVSILTERRLTRLMTHSFPGLSLSVVGPEAVVVALGSLGCAFRRDRADFPGSPYLRPTAEATARARALLGPRTAARRVGISWRGGTGVTGIHRRSLPLADLAPVLRATDVEFVSLQYGDHAAEIEAANRQLPRPLRTLPAEALHDFDDLAAVATELDGVLSVQTALIHLCGGLGVPCTVMVPETPEWRYGAAGETLPWYASVRLVRQTAGQGWAPVIAEAWRDLSGRLTAG